MHSECWVVMPIHLSWQAPNDQEQKVFLGRFIIFFVEGGEYFKRVYIQEACRNCINDLLAQKSTCTWYFQRNWIHDLNSGYSNIWWFLSSFYKRRKCNQSWPENPQLNFMGKNRNEKCLDFLLWSWCIHVLTSLTTRDLRTTAVRPPSWSEDSSEGSWNT